MKNSYLVAESEFEVTISRAHRVRPIYEETANNPHFLPMWLYFDWQGRLKLHDLSMLHTCDSFVLNYASNSKQ